MKTGILVHGCNLGAENWRCIAWGDPPDAFGRIPLGVLLAYEYDASVVVFGTGASKKEYRFGGQSRGELLEAEYSCEMLKDNFNELEKFSVFSKRCKDIQNEDTRKEIETRFFNSLVLDVKSTTTPQEIEEAGNVFAEHSVDRIILVSSPTHIVRCLRDAMTIYRSDKKYASFSDNVAAIPSITCYEGTSPKDVTIVEPPHRPDRHVIPTHRRMERMLKLHKLPYEELVKLIEEFDDLLQRYEHKFYRLEK
ncbi:MAG: hypothetical protein PVG39_07490 [Desulfobacteraceae bacterium]|jgi:hypothetical protein